MRKLPLDTSVFSRLRNLNYLYIDKTEYIYRMITGGHRFFLSRPRRFGKSLLVSTLKEVLSGHRELFDGLWIAQSDYQWQEHGIIALDFSTLPADTLAIFEDSLKRSLIDIAVQYDVIIDRSHNEISGVLKQLTHELFKRFGRVAILIDEYDSPILKTLYNEELAKAIRNKVQQFFTTIKGLDEQVPFAFFTGVSSFAKAGLFSGINNLQILSLDKRFAGICGYTDEEIDHYFKEYIFAWAESNEEAPDILRQRIKTWYNGYHFGHNATAVYNPFSLMYALSTQEFNNFWFQSGTPTFLIEILKKNYTEFNPDKFQVSKDFLSMFDVGNIPIISLMFQAGYLTITDYDSELELYTLDYPNWEVKRTFQKYLLEIFAHIEPTNAALLSAELSQAFNNQNIEEVVALLKQLFAHVPYQLHMKAEKYYHSLFMMICIGAGIKAQSEYSTSHGRIDLILEFPAFTKASAGAVRHSLSDGGQKIIYVIEVKFNDTAVNALNQIEERRYYERFVHEKKQIILLGLSFKKEPHDFDITYAVKEL
jgi:hypothetical protein